MLRKRFTHFPLAYSIENAIALLLLVNNVQKAIMAILRNLQLLTFAIFC